PPKGEEKNSPPLGGGAGGGAKRKLSFKEQKEYESLEQEIEGLEARKAALVAKLNAGSPDHAQITVWAKEIETIEAELNAKSDRWLELGEFV
ncbi:MAG: ABC transporter C-terminal domain-containing protein, partial [Cytophagales bacterium]|nr:ABC transporter C-terminal domain-containing protein [Cytophagales bacterium]